MLTCVAIQQQRNAKAASRLAGRASESLKGMNSRNSTKVTCVRNYLLICICTLLISCSDDSEGSPPVPVPPPAQNRPPQFTSPDGVVIRENLSNAYNVGVTDADNDALTVTISGGEDANSFELRDGVAYFRQNPDFEFPGDSDEDNVYKITLSVTDGTATTTKNVTIRVENDREGISVRRVASGLDRPVSLTGRDGDANAYVLLADGTILMLNPASGEISTISKIRTATLPGPIRAIDFTTSTEWRTPQVEDGQFFVLLQSDKELRLQQHRVSLGADRGESVLSLGYYEEEANATITLGSTMETFLRDDSGSPIRSKIVDLIFVATGAGKNSLDAAHTDNFKGKLLRMYYGASLYPDSAEEIGFHGIPENSRFKSGFPEGEFIDFIGISNPSRLTTGLNLIFADRGPSFQEINVLAQRYPRGSDFGWPSSEGAGCYSCKVQVGAYTAIPTGTGPGEISQIIGGHVVGEGPDALKGSYVFSAESTSNIWFSPKALTDISASFKDFAVRNRDLEPDVGSIDQVVAFGRDGAGFVYIIDTDGEIFRIE